jgi:hypothetical protein
MKDYKKEMVRQQRIHKLIDERCGGVMAEFARRIEMSPTYVTRMLYPVTQPGRRGISVNTIDRIETAFSLAKGWVDGVDEPDPHLAAIMALWSSLPDYKKVAVVRVVKSLSEPDDTDKDPVLEKKPTNGSPCLVIAVSVPLPQAPQGTSDSTERRRSNRRRQDEIPLVVVQH